jgi:hypothetical protein
MRRRAHLSIGVAVAVFLLLAPATAEASPTAPHWAVVRSPNTDHLSNTLYGVLRVSATDAWAVGGSGGTGRRPLVEHWDGSLWSIVHAARVRGSGAWFNALAATSSTDVWAVGGQATFGEHRYKPLIEHFDGTQWEIVPSPSPGRLTFLSGVSASSPNDAWAVGSLGPYNGRESEPLALHWDGRRWQEISTPSTESRFTYFMSVEQTSATDVWAVGGYTRRHRTHVLPLTEHWDGTSWSIVSNPAIADGASLDSVSASSSSDVWAVGVTDVAPDEAIAISEHWDGTSWQLVPLDIGAGSALTGVSVASRSDVWAVGLSGGFLSPVFEHYNGSRWQRVEAAPPPKGGGEMVAIAAWSHGAIAVGDYLPDPDKPKSRTLIEQCCS